MSPKTLKHIKKELSKFYKLVETITDYRTDDNTRSPHYTVLSVLLQNMQADTSDCHGYTHEEAVNKLNHIQALIENLAKYYSNDHTILWVSEEVNTIINGNEMSEFYNDMSEPYRD